MRTPRLLPALFLCLAFAGCLDPEDGGGPGASAMDLRSVADRDAAAWDASARLQGVLGAEWDRTLDGMAFQEASPPEDGGSIGDGETPGWRYLYANDAGLLRAVTVLNDGTVAASKEWQGGGGGVRAVGDGAVGVRAIGDWRIDSDEAARLLAQADPSFAQRVQAGAQVGWSLSAQAPLEPVPEDHDHAESQPPAPAPVWRAVVAGPAEREVTAWSLDAVDGTFLGAADVGLVPKDVDPEAGAFSGLLDLAAQQSFTFPIEHAGHPGLQVRFSATGSGLATVRVLGPGLAAPVEQQWGPLPDDLEIVVPAPMAGDWRVEVRLDVGTVLPFQVEWCASGVLLGIPQDC